MRFVYALYMYYNYLILSHDKEIFLVYSRLEYYPNRSFHIMIAALHLFCSFRHSHSWRMERQSLEYKIPT